VLKQVWHLDLRGAAIGGVVGGAAGINRWWKNAKTRCSRSKVNNIH